MVGLYEDIILRTIRKTSLIVVPGTLEQSILLVAGDIDVVSFELVEHDHALGTLDAGARVIFAKDWSVSSRERAGGGLDVSDSAIVTDHKFVWLAAVVGDPESGADAPSFGALRHVCGDVVGSYSAERSAAPRLSIRDREKRRKCVLVVGGENDEIIESDLADVVLVRDGKGVAGCI